MSLLIGTSSVTVHISDDQRYGSLYDTIFVAKLPRLRNGLRSELLGGKFSAFILVCETTEYAFTALVQRIFNCG